MLFYNLPFLFSSFLIWQYTFWGFFFVSTQSSTSFSVIIYSLLNGCFIIYVAIPLLMGLRRLLIFLNCYRSFFFFFLQVIFIMNILIWIYQCPFVSVMVACILGFKCMYILFCDNFYPLHWCPLKLQWSTYQSIWDCLLLTIVNNITY